MKKHTRNHFKMLLIGTAVSILFSASAFSAGTSSGQFLKMGAGARAAGMGDAFSSISDDVTATVWNPAGLSQLRSPEINLMHNSGLVDTQYQFAAGAMPAGKSAIGVSIQRLDFGDIEKYSSGNVRQGDFDAASLAAGLTWSRKVHDWIRLGATGKFINETIEEEKASTFALDFGLLTELNRFNLSLSAHNFGGKLEFVKEKEDLPFSIRVGASTFFFKDKLLLGLDISKPNDNDAKIHAGVEYRLMEFLQIRGGYQGTPGNQLDIDGLTNLTGGLGLSIGRFNLDYAFLPFGDLGDHHRLSMSIHFNPN